MSDLKPCPFCGSPDTPKVITVINISWVGCDIDEGGCGASGSEGATEAEAIAAWNTRADSAKPVASDLIERLRACAATLKCGGDAFNREVIALELAAEAITAKDAEIARYREVLDAAWGFATDMRNASKLVGPYERDPRATKIWQRSLYHKGKELHELLKPARQALGASHDV